MVEKIQRHLTEEQEDTGIMSLAPQNIDPEKVQYFEEATQETTKPQKTTEQKKDSLFSPDQMKGLFAANVALALARPGDPIANLGLGFSWRRYVRS